MPLTEKHPPATGGGSTCAPVWRSPTSPAPPGVPFRGFVWMVGGYYLIVHTEERLGLLRRRSGAERSTSHSGVAVSQGQIVCAGLTPWAGAAYPSSGGTNCRRMALTIPAAFFPAVALGHLHGLVDGGRGRHLVQKQDLVAPEAQDVADDGLQPLPGSGCTSSRCNSPAASGSGSPIAQAGGQRRVPAVQPFFGDGALQAAIGPCVGAVHLHQDLQGGLSGVRLSHVAHAVTCRVACQIAGHRHPLAVLRLKLQNTEGQTVAAGDLDAGLIGPAAIVPGAALTAPPTSVRYTFTVAPDSSVTAQGPRLEATDLIVETAGGAVSSP